jgi:uncharacterized membrane protein
MMNNFDLTDIVSITASILCLLIIGVIWKRRGFREQTVRLLVLYAAVSCVWELIRAFSRLGWLSFLAGAVLAPAISYGALVLSLLFLHLSRSFLRLEGAGRDWWAVGTAWVAALIVLDSNLLALPEVLWLGNGWFIERQMLAFGVLLLGWGVFMGGATILTVMAYRRTRQPLHRNRITYWSLALGLVVAGAALFFARREPLSSGFYLLGTLIAAYVVLTHHLPDVRQAVRRTVRYLIVTLLAVGIYTAGFLAAHYLFQTVPGYSPVSIGVALALALALLFDPLLRLAQRLVDRLISGHSHDPIRTLREYSTSNSNILDQERLAMVAVGIYTAGFLAAHYLFQTVPGYSPSAGRKSRGRLPAPGACSPDPVRRRPASPLPGNFSGRTRLVVRPEHGRLRAHLRQGGVDWPPGAGPKALG